VAELAEQHFEGRVSLQTAPQRYLASAQSEWDLAQFDCAASRGARQRKRFSSGVASLMQAPRWRAARWALVALLAVNLVGIASWNWKEQSALADKRTAIREVLTGTFPNVTVVVDAPLQMARAVSDLQRQTGTATGADLETMLLQFYTMAPAMPAPAAIEFVAGELKIKGLNPAAKGIERLATKLEGMGYQARLEGDTLVMQQGRRP
jgi:general secretion pathway protein L